MPDEELGCILTIPTALEQLWCLTNRDLHDAATDWEFTFASIGLILLVPPRNMGYWCTPTNSFTFATTGGDGVHFGYLAIPDLELEFAPIVMTVPMGDKPNLIVGANLTEFLSLGCRLGYFGLEQLVYDFPKTVAALVSSKFDPEILSVDRALLAKLSLEFNLEPWPDPASRLLFLQNQYLPLLELPDGEDTV